VVLADRDPADITFDQVAEAAGVSRGLVYNYFGDKGGLLAAVYLRNFEPLVDALEGRLGATERVPESQLRAVVDTYVSFAADNPSAWKLMGSAEAAEHPVVRRARREHIGRISASWGDSPEARVLARGIIGFLEAATIEWLDDAELPADRAADIIHAQLWAGLAAEPEPRPARPQSGTTVSAARQQYHATTLR
jgi:AcrR family transcriptional regulator